MEKVLPSLARLYAKQGIPYSSTIELLAPCNLRCSHCYVTKHTPSVLTFERLIDLFEQMRDLGSFSITFTGGEIALRSDLYDLISAARKMRFAVYLLSSGTLWGRMDWDRIALLGVSGVRMSVYGMTPKVHDAVTRVAGSHQKTFQSVQGLLARNVDVSFATPIMAINIHEVVDVLAYCAQNKLSISMDPNISISDAGDRSPQSTLASKEQLTQLFADPRVHAYIAQHGPIDLHAEPCSNSPGPRDRPCGVGEHATFIRATGNVYPCGTWPIKAGNILSQSYADIWFHSAVFNQARALRNQDLTGCGGCAHRATCSPCAAMNIQDAGSVQQPSVVVCNNTAARALA